MKNKSLLGFSILPKNRLPFLLVNFEKFTCKNGKKTVFFFIFSASAVSAPPGGLPFSMYGTYIFLMGERTNSTLPNELKTKEYFLEFL